MQNKIQKYNDQTTKTKSGVVERKDKERRGEQCIRVWVIKKRKQKKNRKEEIVTEV